MTRCSHSGHSPKGICVGCREQHVPVGGYSDAELTAMEADFWREWPDLASQQNHPNSDGGSSDQA